MTIESQNECSESEAYDASTLDQQDLQQTFTLDYFHQKYQRRKLKKIQMLRGQSVFSKNKGGLDKEKFRESVFGDRMLENVKHKVSLATVQPVSFKSISDGITPKFQERSSQSSAMFMPQRNSFDKVDFKTEEPQIWAKHESMVNFRDAGGQLSLLNSLQDTAKDTQNKDRLH